MKYNFEYKRKIRAGVIGCGGHAYRNIFPTFQYAPIDLIAVCDLDFERARAFARQFGAQRFYRNHRKMLQDEELDAIFIVTGYEKYRPRFPKLAMDGMRSGCHVWMEKPPASSVREVEETIEVSKTTGKFAMVGFKKVFSPAISKVKEIIGKKEFGKATSIYLRYPQSLPPPRERRSQKAMVGFLDHIVHPASILIYLMGRVETIFVESEDVNGDAVVAIRFVNGGVGTLHLAAGQSGTSPLERLEVIGNGANVVVKNGVKLTYYRRGSRGPEGYGRIPDYIGDDVSAPICWEPEFSLGQLYNKGLFLLGYVQEISYFAECVLRKSKPGICNLEFASEVMKFYEAFRGRSGRVIKVN